MCFTVIICLVVNALSPLDKVFHLRSNKIPSLDGKIVGGANIDIEDVPYQVSLQNYERHNCGGSIISKDWLVTAGHCVEGTSRNIMTVRSGSSFADSSGTIHEVSSVVLHASYDSNTMDYDIALIKVSSPFNIGTKYVDVVELPEEGEEPKDGTDAIVSGWGTMSGEHQMLPSQLQSVDVPIVSRRVCQLAYAIQHISDRMICAGFLEGGKDACQGDSGGPMVINNVLVGVVSWGLGCATPGYVGVYTNVANLREWIRSNSGV